MAKYPYYSPQENIWKPWVGVRLGYKRTHKVTPNLLPAVVDSGADVCFCDQNIGIWLGVQFKNRRPTSFTAANCTKFGAFSETITLYFGGRSYECPFFFAQLPKETPVILGQRGFFDHFKVTFDLANKEIEIT